MLLLAAIIAFAGCLAGSFHFDDYSLFAQDLWRPLDIRPITYLTFWMNERAGGRSPIGYHAVNLFLHLIAVVLLWHGLRPLLPATAALVATAIFAGHPFQAEPVNYIFARSTLLAAVFCLASLVCWTRSRPWLAAVWFFAALLAKEECAAFPVFLLLLNLSAVRGRREWRPIAVMLLLSLAAGSRVMLAASHTPGSGAGSGSAVSWQHYAVTQGVVILRYLRMLAAPWGFTVDADIAIPPLWIGALAWAAVLVLALIATRRFTQLGAGFWFLAGLILLLPSSSVLPASDLAADRRMYLPIVAFAACAALLLQRVRPLYLASILAVFVALSAVRTATWKTEESLWTDAVAKAPAKIRPKIQLARAVEPRRALEILEEAKRLSPDDPAIASEAGRIYLGLGQPVRALTEFGRALALAPRSADALNNRGAALLALDQKEAAREDFERALTLDPCQFDARLNLLHAGVAKPAPPQCRFTREQTAALRGN